MVPLKGLVGLLEAWVAGVLRILTGLSQRV